MTDDPTSLLGVLAALSPLLAALVAVGGVIGTIVFTNRRERERQEHERLLALDRQEHERLLKGAELGAARAARLRDERIRAYSALAGLTKRVDVAPGEPALLAVAEAHSEVEMLAEDPRLLETAGLLFRTWEDAWRSVVGAIDEEAPDPYDVPGYKNARGLLEASRAAFIGLARDEIGAGAHGAEPPPEGSAPNPTEDGG